MLRCDWAPLVPPYGTQSLTSEQFLKLWEVTPEPIRGEYSRLTASGTCTTLVYTPSSRIELPNHGSHNTNSIRVSIGSKETKQDHAAIPPDQAVHDATLTVARGLTHPPALPKEPVQFDLPSHTTSCPTNRYQSTPCTSSSSSQSSLLDPLHPSSRNCTLPENGNPFSGSERVISAYGDSRNIIRAFTTQLGLDPSPLSSTVKGPTPNCHHELNPVRYGCDPLPDKDAEIKTDVGAPLYGMINSYLLGIFSP